MAKTVVNRFNELTFQEIFDGIESQGYIERTYNDMTTQIKNTKSYKSMMKVAEKTIYNTTFDTPVKDAISKKTKIQEIELIASDYDYSISTILAKAIESDAKFIVETFIKRLSTTKQCMDPDMYSPITSPIKKRLKRSSNNSPGRNTTVYAYLKSSFRQKLDDSDNECGSVSSVHTSELSSLEDEIVLPVEDKDNGKIEKTISFKAVNQAYKSLVSTNKKTPKRKSSFQKSPRASNFQKSPKKDSNEAVGTDDHEWLPKRIPKPNSRYSSGDN